MVDSSEKIRTRDETLSWRRNRSGVVFTNGVFDVIHPGHVEVLERASALGDCLVVALNDDTSAARLQKGAGRPFNRFPDRARVVAALACVDCVTAFGEDTPVELIEQLLPDVLVKGGDWAGRPIPGAACVERNGGEVHTVDYLVGQSTTELVRRIRDAI